MGPHSRELGEFTGFVEVRSETFAALLRRLRERAALTQESLAARAGLSAKAVSALERGERQHPYPYTVRALADALGLSLQERTALEASVPRRMRPRTPDPVDRGRPDATPVTATLPVPCQLPSSVRGFTGRAVDLAKLDALLERVANRDTPPAVVVAAISGTAGVGKTTLAVAWTRLVRERFPDGQLYVDLRGYAPEPAAAPGDVLDGFLRALDVPATKIPPSLDDRTALFRSIVDGRRMLVVLDNANSAEQVRPLLPGSASCLVVVTSRHQLTGLAVSVGVHRIVLGLLPVEEAVTLLHTIIGRERADAEPEAAAELVRLCARLPLAIQLAGQRMAARPDAHIADLVAELASDTGRLEVLSAGVDEFTAVRPVFSWSCRNLPADQARMFRLLGVHPGPDFDVLAAAAIARIGEAHARRVLDHLLDVHLIESAGRNRFRMHDLLRAYARELAAADPAEVRDAVGRLAGFYLHTAAAADRMLLPRRRGSPVDGAAMPGPCPCFTGYEPALAWCEAERANLVAVTGLTADTGLLAAAWQLPDNLWSFYYIRKHWSDWIEACRTGLAAACHLGNQYGQARMHAGLAAACRDLHRFDEADSHNRAALALYRGIGDRYGEAVALTNLGDAGLALRRFDDVLANAGAALTVFRELGDQYATSVALANVAEAYLGLGDLDQAIRNFRRVVELCREIGHRYGEGRALTHLGEAFVGLRRHDDAGGHLVEGLRLAREIGDRHGEVLALDNLGTVHERTGSPDQADRCWRTALVIYDDLGDPRADELRTRLGAGSIIGPS